VDVAAVEFDILLRQPVVTKQPNDLRHRDGKTDRADPVVRHAFGVYLKEFTLHAQLRPTVEGVRCVCIIFAVDDLGEVTDQQGKSPPRVGDADGHPVLVEHKDV
jgi:hypothetical protein